jgi:hypothetical protein
VAAKRKPMSAATKAKLSRAMKGKKHPHKGHPMSAAARAKLSAALKGKHHKGHAESASTRAKIAAKLRLDAARRSKTRASKAIAKARARVAKAQAKKTEVIRHRGTTARRGRLHGVHRRRTPGGVVRVSRLREPRPQLISRHHRLSSLNRRRRKFG